MAMFMAHALFWRHPEDMLVWYFIVRPQIWRSELIQDMAVRHAAFY